MNKTLRQGLYILFILLVFGLGVQFLKLTYAEALIIIALAGIVLKLTDIQDTIRGGKNF